MFVHSKGKKGFDMTNLLSVKEAANVLGISPPTLRLWTWQGKLAVVNLGRRRLYRPEDLEAFIVGNLQHAQEGVGEAGHDGA